MLVMRTPPISARISLSRSNRADLVILKRRSSVVATMTVPSPAGDLDPRGDGDRADRSMGRGGDLHGIDGGA